MNFKENVIKGMKKSTTVLALTVIFGQTMFPAMEVFADDGAKDATTEETVEQLSTETESTESTFDPKVLEIINDSLLTEEGKAMKMYSVFEGMSKVSYGYTTEAGEEVTVQEQANPLSRMILDMSEYTPYTFRVDLNGYWAEGQMPVLRDTTTREVLFCIEPGVAAIAGPGYTPADLTPQQRTWFEDIGNFGYPMEQSHEMYFTSQGYMWEKMGSTFSGNYGGYTAKKAQIDANIAAYYTRPSFDGDKVTVKMGEPLTLTDTNGVLEEYVRDVSTGGLGISRNGNNLTLTVTENTEENPIVRMRKTMTDGVSIAYIQDGAQMLGKFSVSDPVQFTLNVEAIKTGKVRIGKQDEVTGKFVPNTSYEGTIGDEQVAFTTGADGHHELPKEYIHGTPFSFVETNVPEGYVLDQTPITGTVVGGQTITLIQQNTHQLAEITFEKEQEVFDAEETTLQGTPVYKDIPLEG
ncbi:SpaA isopeptide-forming pilin-related protein, partial [Enterococcus sp. 5H]|uniref:SpaA isopeptide-forming pilin-related protein n=1 Tax=Enterococcus sp. 5H TaxID=1229490 RepID=UPI00230398BD